MLRINYADVVVAAVAAFVVGALWSVTVLVRRSVHEPHR